MSLRLPQPYRLQKILQSLINMHYAKTNFLVLLTHHNEKQSIQKGFTLPLSNMNWKLVQKEKSSSRLTVKFQLSGT